MGFRHLTSNNTSEPFYWRFFSELQYSRGEHVFALESRLKQIRAAKARLWEIRDPEKFTKELEDLHECFDAVEEYFNNDNLQAEARKQLQPFSYSLRDTVQTLQGKIDEATNTELAWVPTFKAIYALAERMEHAASSAA